MIIDTHTHLNAEQLYAQRTEIIARARTAGLGWVINCADTLESCERVADLADEFPDFCFSAYGVIPNEIKGADLQKLFDIIARRPRNLLAVGEIGLDYHYDNSPANRHKEREYFLAQIAIARRCHLPIIVHSRDADRDTFATLYEAARDLTVTLHCYSGSAELAAEYVEAFPRIYFGIGGVVTFKNARRLVEVVSRIDLKHLVLETDAPYLTPEPFRGRLNEPSYLPYVAARIAAIKGVSTEEVIAATSANAQEIYRIK